MDPLPIPEHLAKRGLKFKPESEIKDKTLIGCLPRTGSNMMKNVLEDITGYFSGDDANPSNKFAIYLMEKGNVKGVVRNTYFIKSHSPLFFTKGFRIEEDYQVHKSLLLVRNPINSIPSLFELIAFKNPTKVASDGFYTRNTELFDQCVRDMCVWINEWFDFWLAQRIPVHFVRYEDLFGSSYEVLLGIMTFVEGKNIKGTETDAKIKERLEKKGLGSTYLDKPRTSGSKAHRFTKDQLLYLAKTLDKFIQFFGYEREFEEALGKECGLFNYERDEEFKKGRKLNEEAINRILSADYAPESLEVPGGHRAPEIGNEGEFFRTAVRNVYPDD